jgi:hypothetical protein
MRSFLFVNYFFGFREQLCNLLHHWERILASIKRLCDFALGYGCTLFSASFSTHPEDFGMLPRAMTSWGDLIELLLFEDDVTKFPGLIRLTFFMYDIDILGIGRGRTLGVQRPLRACWLYSASRNEA